MKYGYVLVVQAQFTIKNITFHLHAHIFYLFWGRISIDIELRQGVNYTGLVHNFADVANTNARLGKFKNKYN